jgi:hypothetical protein
VTQTSDDLQDHLYEQRDFLVTSCPPFDRGHRGESKRLATSMRISVHDTRDSVSLLQLMRRKADLLFVDSPPADVRTVPDNGSISTFCGLSIPSAGGLQEPRSVATKGAVRGPGIAFSEWWTLPIGHVYEHGKFTRKDAVMWLSNKDGGAHIDPSLPPIYRALGRQNAFGHRVGLYGGPSKVSVPLFLRSSARSQEKFSSLSNLALGRSRCQHEVSLSQSGPDNSLTVPRIVMTPFGGRKF